MNSYGGNFELKDEMSKKICIPLKRKLSSNKIDAWFTCEEIAKINKAIKPKMQYKITIPLPVQKKQVATVKIVKTRMCRNILQHNKCSYKNCNFAHFVNELTPVYCKFKDRCRRQKNCHFVHPNENRRQYAQRLGLEHLLK